MIFICLVFLSFFTGTEKVSAQEDIEGTFLSDIFLVQHDEVNNFLANSPGAIVFFCQWIFSTDNYKYEWKVHLNVIAFHKQNRYQENNQPVTFTQKKYFKYNSKGNKIYQKMIPCYGQHRPIRTDWKTDDYRKTFFVAKVRFGNSVYVFRKTIRFKQEVFVIHDRIELPMDQQRIPELQIPIEAVTTAYILNTVETINYDEEVVEKIYMDEVPTTETIPFEDPLLRLDGGRKVTVCISIFLEKFFKDKGYTFDEEAFFHFGTTVYQLGLSFRKHSTRKRLQLMYQCGAREVKGSSNNIYGYYLSSGRRPNSIFVYRTHYHDRTVAIPVYFIENFDFTHLTPSDQNDLTAYIYNVKP